MCRAPAPGRRGRSPRGPACRCRTRGRARTRPARRPRGRPPPGRRPRRCLGQLLLLPLQLLLLLLRLVLTRLLRRGLRLLTLFPVINFSTPPCIWRGAIPWQKLSPPTTPKKRRSREASSPVGVRGPLPCPAPARVAGGRGRCAGAASCPAGGGGGWGRGIGVASTPLLRELPAAAATSVRARVGTAGSSAREDACRAGAHHREVPWRRAVRRVAGG